MAIPRRRTLRSYFTAILAVAILLLLAGAASALDNGQCFDCHGDQGILGWSAAEKASNVTPGGPKEVPHVGGHFPGMSLFIDAGLYKQSVHADVSCTDCHADIKGVPHVARLKRVDCSGCHSEVAAAYAKSRHVLTFGKTPIGNAPVCVDCHGAHAVPKSSVSTSPVYFRNIATTCTRCHGDKSITDNRNIAIPGAAKQYEQSIHNRAIVDKGLNKSANCIDCHGAHNMKDRRDPSSSINKTNLPATCGKCHFGVFALYKQSVHGTALARGVPDAPGCADCHGEHDIRSVSDPNSPVSFNAISQKTCPSCHAAEKLAARYGVPVDKVRGYQQSFHGLSARLGDKTVANCASCHGDHAIYPSSDPRSTVYPKNLPVTCGKCHPGATANFASGNIHVGPGGTGGRIKYWVEQFYIWMIVVVIGGMVAHNGVDYFRKMQAIYRKRRQWKQPAYERLNRSERTQHILTLSTFFTLVITGFALKFKWSIPLISDEANVALRGWSHRGLHRPGPRPALADAPPVEGRGGHRGDAPVLPRPRGPQAEVRAVQLRGEGGVPRAGVGHGRDGRHRLPALVPERGPEAHPDVGAGRGHDHPLLRSDPGHPGDHRLAPLLRVREPGFRPHVLHLDRREALPARHGA
jgi:hypothetical protein